MKAVKIFSIDFSEKNRVFFHDKLFNGMIFAERLATDTSCVAFWCAHTLKIIATVLFSHNAMAFFVSSSYHQK